MDMQRFLRRKMVTKTHIDLFDTMLYLVVSGVEKNILYVTQFLIILGKFHIHTWSRIQTLLSLSYCWTEARWHLKFKTKSEKAKKIFQYF